MHPENCCAFGELAEDASVLEKCDFYEHLRASWLVRRMFFRDKG